MVLIIDVRHLLDLFFKSLALEKLNNYHLDAIIHLVDSAVLIVNDAEQFIEMFGFAFNRFIGVVCVLKSNEKKT